jgi:hypothetical protein
VGNQQHILHKFIFRSGYAKAIGAIATYNASIIRDRQACRRAACRWLRNHHKGIRSSGRFGLSSGISGTTCAIEDQPAFLAHRARQRLARRLAGNATLAESGPAQQRLAEEKPVIESEVLPDLQAWVS